MQQSKYAGIPVFSMPHCKFALVQGYANYCANLAQTLVNIVYAVNMAHAIPDIILPNRVASLAFLKSKLLLVQSSLQPHCLAPAGLVAAVMLLH